jgi:hypothetical protein
VGEAYSPVLKAIEKIVELFDAKGSIGLYSYEKADDFTDLWSMVQTKTDGSHEGPPSAKMLIVVWDGLPARPDKSDSVDITRYITPIDWAVAFSLSVRERTKEGSWPDLTISIVDAGGLSGSGSGTLTFFEHFERRTVKTMPWIRIFGPGKETDVWGFDSLLFNIACAALPPGRTFPFDIRPSELVRSMKGTLEYEKQGLDVIKTYLAANLTRPSEPGDHHAIANIVGPLLLMKNELADPQVNALQILMRQLNLLPREEQTEAFLSPKKSWINLDTQPWKKALDDAFGDSEGPRDLILIDDMFPLGWGKMLCWGFGVEYNPHLTESSQLTEIGRSKDGRIVIKACSHADPILQKLEKLPENSLDQRFGFKIDESQNISEASEIIFLDLRLFSGRLFSEEVSFFKRVLCIAEKLSMRKNLPWEGFAQAEVKRVKDWIESTDPKREDPLYIEALTFLPRILSLIDLALPIVIFSSTGRRDITEKLKPYRNIITAFDKPKFTVDIPHDIAAQTHRKFEMAFEKALEILAARQKCKTIIERGNEVSKAVSNMQLQASSIYVELFVDESRDNTNNKFSVGGCFAVFDGNTLSEAKERADQFEDELVNEGIRYFDAFGIGPTPPKIKNKKNNSIVELSAVVTKSSNKPMLLGAVRLLSDPYRPIDVESDLLHPNSIDNRYRLTLNALLELVIFETIPAIVTATGKIKAVVSLYVATRGKFMKAHLSDKIKKDRYRFGVGALEINKGNFIQYSMSEDSIYPILMDVFSSHEKSVPIDRSLGIQLPYRKEVIEYPDCFVCRKCKGVINVRKDVINGKLTKPLTCPTCGQSSDLRPDYRALHYIADEILGNFPNEKAAGVYDPVFPASLSSGQFNDTLNEDLQRLLLASRALDRGDIINAVGYLLVSTHITPNSMPTAKEWITMRIAPLLKHIDGSDFLGIVDKLSEMDYIPYYSVVIKKKQSKKNPNYFFYDGILQEGPDRGRKVFIPPKLYKSRMPVEGEVLRTQYLRNEKGLVAQRLAL